MTPEEFAATRGLTVRTEYEPATTDGRHARKFFEFSCAGQVVGTARGRAEAESWVRGWRAGMEQSDIAYETHVMNNVRRAVL